MLVISRGQVRDILAGQEHEVLHAVRAAYLLHHEGQTALPHSVFLRLPQAGGAPSANRIIGLPAYVGGPNGAAGMKWIASFPGNIQRGIDRASAVIVLNSLETGHPLALVEGSLISAARTAASAALAADALVSPETAGIRGISLIGCGVINATILRYVHALHPTLVDVTVYDLDPVRAVDFAERCSTAVLGVKVGVADTVEAALTAHDLVSLATTASTPHLDLTGAAGLPPTTTVLHVSLRDLSTGTILANHNIVDDVDHVCREQTSIHLTELETGGRDFIDGTLTDLMLAGKPFPRQFGKSAFFSPFGLGALDIAVAQFVLAEATRRGLGIGIQGFLDDAGEATDSANSPS
ncbi:MAG TPA: 2,3-diaminopropionate biosynthesis protein SbnB [Asanoa sp.]|jgi:2,3-diaminopropionate biosynthesis protein SbnB|nr:2,3-diaminopropionate biosynthesis protein SbnB [Asanoa sp.]